MNPKELEAAKQKLEQYQTALRAVKMMEFEREALPSSIAKPSSAQANQIKLNFSNPARAAIERSDQAFFHSCLETFNELEPNEYYENLAKQNYIPKDEFLKALEKFSNNKHSVDLQDRTNNLDLAINRESTISKESISTVPEKNIGSIPEGPLQQQEQEQQQTHENQPQQSAPAEQQTPIRRESPPPPRIINIPPLTNRERFVNRENYAQYKTENKESRDLQARRLLDKRQRTRMTAQDWSRHKEENRDERQERAKKIQEDRKKAALLRPKPTSAGGWNPLTDWLGKKLAQSRLGQWAGNALRGIADKLGLGRFANALSRLNSLLSWPERMIGRLLGQAGRGALNLTWNIGRSLLNGIANSATGAVESLTGASSVVGGWLTTAGAFFAGAGGALSLGLLTILLGALALFIFQQKEFEDCGQGGALTAVKSTAKDSYQPGEAIQYELLIQYRLNCLSSTIDNVEVRDPLPPGTTFIENSDSAAGYQLTDPITPTDPLNPNSLAEPVPNISNENPNAIERSNIKPTVVNNTLVWKIGTLSPNIPVVLKFSVTAPSESDIWLVNQATVTYKETGVKPGTGVVPPGGDEPPSQDNCDGAYRLTSPYGNFGDPSCNFKKEDLFTLLQQQDPAEATYWFETLVRKESSYNPNAYNPGSTSGAGAFGLFQMNPNAGKDTYDAGNVAWQRQSSNAVNYNNYLKTIGRVWCYWEAANERWPALCRQ